VKAMSETDNNIQGPKIKTSRLAIASLALAILSLTSLLSLYIISYVEEQPLRGAITIIIPLIAAITTLSAPIFGIISIFRIKKRKNRLKGTGIATVAILIAIVSIGLTVDGLIRTYRNGLVIICGEVNLKLLSIAMMMYADDSSEQYPTANNWCDLLIEYSPLIEKALVCRAGGEGRSHYAINPYCEPNSPNDVVLLFETKGGWNQFGGPEILTFNHKGKGCNVLFNDHTVRFITPKEIGELKWKPDQKQ
jgi:hypothetical protein